MRFWPGFWPRPAGLFRVLVLSRWPLLRSMVCAAVDGLCCGRWPVLWRRLVFRSVAGRGCGRVLRGWPLVVLVAVAGAGSDGRALRGRSVIRMSCWDRWGLCCGGGRCCRRWPVLWSMAGALVDGRGCGRWRGPGQWRRLVFRLVALVA